MTFNGKIVEVKVSRCDLTKETWDVQLTNGSRMIIQLSDIDFMGLISGIEGNVIQPGVEARCNLLISNEIAGIVSLPSGTEFDISTGADGIGKGVVI